MKPSPAKVQKAMIPILVLLGSVFVMLMLGFPEEALQAALKGIAIWWDVLFPALFPFLVISELLLGFGIVHFIGMLLDPMMRPVFRVPGIGGFVMAMGFASGYPVGAKLTAQIWDDKLVTREEGERLIGFTTTGDPIFLIGAVSIGFFHNAGLAIILAAAHYGSAILVGILMRFYRSSAPPSHDVYVTEKGRSIVVQAFEAMHRARLKDGRTLGLILQSAVRSSIALIIVIGGLVVFFSVLMEMLRQSGVMSFIYQGAGAVLGTIGIPKGLAEAAVRGFFEVTLGAQAAGQFSQDGMLQASASVAAFVLSWAGLSVHAQILSLISRTGMRYGPFFVARLLHGLIAACAVQLLWPFLSSFADASKALLPVINLQGDGLSWLRFLSYFAGFLFIASIASIVLCYACYRLLKLLTAPASLLFRKRRH